MRMFRTGNHGESKQWTDSMSSVTWQNFDESSELNARATYRNFPVRCELFGGNNFYLSFRISSFVEIFSYEVYWTWGYFLSLCDLDTLLPRGRRVGDGIFFLRIYRTCSFILLDIRNPPPLFVSH